MRLPAAVEGKPGLVTVVLVLVAAGWRALVWKNIVPPHLENLLSRTDLAVTVALALGLASVAAIAAGFAGAIIVFGISADSAIMRAFRAKTEAHLKANWRSVIGSAFSSAILGLACAFCLAAKWVWLASPLLVFGMLLLLHSIIRMVWLFGVLLSLVSVQDQKETRQANQRSTTDIFKGVA